MFTNTILNYGDGFDSLTGLAFTCPKTGLYWLFYTVVWDGTTYANFTIQGGNQVPVMSIRRLHTTYNKYDIISRDKILNLTLNQQLTVFSSYPTFGNSTLGSGWGALHLDSFLSKFIAFEAYTSPTGTIGKFYQASFNYGNAWNNVTQLFTAPQTGIYYFSLSIGVPANTKVWNNLYLLSTSYCDVEIFETNHNGLDVISRGCLMKLTANQVVSVHWDCTDGDSSYYETSFRGFLYAPVHGIQVAWSVHNSGYITGSGMAMSFPDVLVNVPSTVWQASSNKVIIPVSGTYYVEMVGQTDSYVSALDPMDMRLTLNNTVIISRLYFGSMNNYVTRSLPIFIHLYANSKLTVAYYNVDLFGDNRGGLSFQGFLIYPD